MSATTDEGIISEGQLHVLDVMTKGNIRVAVMGNVDAGKSTLIGTLTHACLDDGNGSNRKLVTKYPHELVTGRTSTVTQHLLAFDNSGETIVAPRSAGRYTDSYLAQRAKERTVSLMDLAGHEKYLKTTIAGLSRGMADYAMVLINASQALTFMSVQHLSLCQMCGIPVIVVITKVDAAPPDVLRHTRKKAAETIRSPEMGKKQFAVRKPADIDQVLDKMHALVPVIEVSCVTGEGLELVRQLMWSLPKRRLHHKKLDRPFEFLLEDKFNVPGVGLILSGFVNAGRIKKGDSLFLGPLKNGTFIKTTAKSIHVAQTLVDEAWAGHSACFAVNLTKAQRRLMNRKGMVLLEKPMEEPVAGFTAEICLAKGDSTMIKGQFNVTMHILHVRENCRLIDFDAVEGDRNTGPDHKLILRPGQRATATFQFLHGSQYIRKGMRVILRDGHVRGIGIIKQLHFCFDQIK